MKRCIPVYLLAGAAFAWSQTASIAPASKPDPEAIAAKDPTKVVATINGKPITARQAADLLKMIPEDQRKSLPSIQGVVQQLYMVSELAKQATAEKLDQQSPTKEQLALERDRVLAQAYVTDYAKKNGTTGDAKQYYDAHTQEYDKATVSGIIVAFNAPGTPASSSAVQRTEGDAKQKADDIEKKLKTGADFATVARTDSDDPQSSSHGGQLGTLAASTPNVPQELKDVIFNKLQPGQISEPVRGNNAYYILKLDTRTKETFEQAKSAIDQQMKADHDRTVAQKVQDQYKIQSPDPAFFGPPPPVAGASATTGSKVPSLAKSGSAPSVPPAQK